MAKMRKARSIRAMTMSILVIEEGCPYPIFSERKSIKKNNPNALPKVSRNMPN